MWRFWIESYSLLMQFMCPRDIPVSGLDISKHLEK
jgi:hypothetical protein